ncbi:unnamed protein product [Durusdinium trenchii]|uniref:Uncharacterized protein n=1 Tax=Durusdinium trenchii TaxID=1381693 RepID=A0ABP0S1F5_9DINO
MEAFLLAKASHPVSISAPVTVPGDRVSLKGQRPSTRSWTPLVPALGGVALIAGSRPIRAARAPQVQRLMAQRPIFDPLNLLTDNEGAMKRATSLELVFGRAAMLAAVGVPSAELWHDEIAAATGLPNILPENGQAPSLMNGNSLNPIFDVVLVTSAVGLSALALEATSKNHSVEEIDQLRMPRLSPMLKSALREAQVFNGRVAMVAIMAIAVQEAMTGQATVNITPFLFAR